MTRKDPQPSPPAPANHPQQGLRQRAEAKARGKTRPQPPATAGISPAAMERTLEEMRIYQIELEMQNEELRRMQAELAASEARYASLYDQAPVGYVTLTEQGLILQANLTAASLLGVARHRLVTQPISRFILREDQDIYYLHRKQLFASGESQVCELRMVKKDQTFFWARLEAVATQDAGADPICSVVLSDITRQKLTAESLRIKSRVFDASITANSIADSTGIITEANEAFLRVWGYPDKAGVIGQPIVHFFKDPNEATAILTALNGAGQWEGSYSAKRRDGSTFIAYGMATVVYNDQGEIIGYQSAVFDITERKRMEEALQETATLLSVTQRLSQVGGWVWNIEEQRMTWTEETYHIHDYAPGEVGTTMEEHLVKSLGCCEEADRPSILAAFQRCAEQGEAYDIEYPFTTCRGRRLWVRTTGQAVWDEQRIVKVVGNIIDITAQRQAAEALRESSELLTLFMSYSPIYSFIKTVTPDESRVLHASNNYQKMLGLAGEGMVGKTMTELFPAEIAAKITADDWTVVASGEMMKMEEELNGRTYSSIKFPIVQGNRTLLAGYTIDITEHKQAAQTMREWNQLLEQRVAERTMELKLSKVRLHQLAEATFEGIAFSEDGRLLDGNAQLGEIHGCELAEMLGRPVMDFIAPASRAQVAKRMQDGNESTYEYVGLRKDGSTFPAEAHARMTTWHGKISRVTALRDLTLIKQAAATLLAQQTELEHAHRLALVSEVSTGIIHQIGQPLCAMGANLAVILAKLNACTIKRCGTLDILKEVEADVGCMRDVMTHMRALANPGQPSYVSIDLNHLLDEALRPLRLEAANRRILLSVGYGHDLPPVLGNPVQLNQVILNVVRNAFDACADGPPERARITVTTRAGAGVELCVRDAGTGIAAEAMERLFAPFFTTKADGLGIGLRLCQTITAAHGGSIEAANNPDGIGATFRVILPANPPTPDPRA